MKKIPAVIIKTINLLLVVVPFLFVWFNSYEIVEKTRLVQSSIILLFIYISLFFFLSSSLDGFKFGIVQLSDLFFGQITGILITNIIAFLLIWMLSISFPNILPILICFAIQIVIVLLCAFFGNKIFFKTHPPKKAIIIYGERYGMEDLIETYNLKVRYEIKGSYSIEKIIASSNEETGDNLGKYFSGVEEVFLCGIHSHERNIILKYCILNSIRTLIIPRIGDVVMESANRTHLFYLPILSVNRYAPSIIYRTLKRTFEIIASGLALIILSPILLVVAILVKSDGGPAFYKQVRLTKNGKEFNIIKFRSMCVNAEKTTGAILSEGKNDQRITKIGRKLRACRLDELPQLWNIFVGDMSFVGPRPERPEIAKEIEKEIPEFQLRLQCKAGLTGYAQVYGKYNIAPYDKLLMDLMYIAKASILEDIMIMIATIKPLFKKESTEGVGTAEAELEYKQQEY